MVGEGYGGGWDINGSDTGAMSQVTSARKVLLRSIT